MFLKKVTRPPIFFRGGGQGVLEWKWKRQNVISHDIT